MINIRYKLSTGKIIMIETTEEIADFISNCIAEDKRIQWRDEKRKDVSLEYLEEINAPIADTAPSPLQILEQKETHDFYTWDLPLPDKLKSVIILHIRNRLTMREIAEKLHISKSAAHKRLFKALNILKGGQNYTSHSVYSVGLKANMGKTEE